ncbi:pyrimidine/purine nucleoside phosphorylase [Psychrobacter sp. I-STPA10]|uniref:pyrimidine/purine nucleoside phosphorylase n=1 Tax=Psychrobacter sp. I-STPA10 TaxID=2585769 RepID=UPI001E312A99|nr:pyrimidine/purine nucleoside phosphorylase [Psychrobacter sp. I-STPA10]
MPSTTYDHVSVVKNANISYDGRCSSHTVLFGDGSKKMLGVILPCDELITEYQFETHTSERIEILTGECEVKIAGEDTFTYHRAGQAFMVAGHSHFVLRTEQIVQYICHLEG